MQLIGLEGMRFNAPHGVHAEEAILRTDFIVDIYIGRSFAAAAKEDDVTKTIDYTIVYALIEKCMSIKRKLIETVAFDIVNQIKAEFVGIESIKLSIKKCPPPLGKEIQNAIVILEQDYTKRCAKCGSKMVCYVDNNCWCQAYTLSPKLTEHLKATYNNCLCAGCLDELTA